MGAANSSREIKVLDCTLSVGGELISWSYGEAVIQAMRPLLLKSGLDMIEYGILQGCALGPNCTSYSSTRLPPCFEKQPGQRYAIVLDNDNCPRLSELPERGERTADIVRVLITRERMDTELAHCTALSQKGYQVVVLINETGQYGRKELSVLLEKIQKVHPWGCYIYDSSGVLNEHELGEVFFSCDQELSPDIWIGFHGRDNLQCVLDLAQMFCSLETERSLCVDVSIGGMGVGAVHLASAKFAGWMNRTFGTNYDLSILKFLTFYTDPYINSKKDAGARLLYHAAAKQKSSYRYVEYYCDLSIEPAEQLGIYAEISEEVAFKFDKNEANKALLRYQQKRLHLAIVVLTVGKPEKIEALLHESSRDLLNYGVDIIIYDGSSDERTYAVTVNYQLESYNNIYYKRYSGEFASSTHDEQVISAYRENLNFDYIWLLRDDLVPTISAFYHEFLSMVESGVECIVVDAAFRNNHRYCIKKYDNSLDFFSDNSARLSVVGTTIFKSEMIKRVLDDQPLGQGDHGFWLPMASLRELASRPVQTGLIVADCFIYNKDSFLKSFYDRKMIEVWGRNWYQAVMGLPAVYESAKAAAVRMQMSDVHPFHLRAMLFLRANGDFGLRIYKRYQQRLSQVSDTAKYKFYFAALLPKSLAKAILRISDYVFEHPNSRFSWIAKKMFHIYVRLGG